MDNIEKLEPRAFTRFCMSIGAVPSSYIAGLTIEEQLLWFCSYLEKTVIPAVNNNAEAVEELQNLYIQLKDYVDNYFDNLDVQEEINNKLDDMAESGELTEIIAQYLALSGMFVYDTVADLVDAPNLGAGSIASTLGFYAKGDCGNATYKIRTITNQDVINNRDLFAITNDDTLVAEYVQVGDTINPAQVGAKFDGETDDTDSWKIAINIANSKKIKIQGLAKNSLISETLQVPDGVSLDTVYLLASATGTFSNNYMIYFNTTDGSNWTVPYNSFWTKFEKIRLSNADQSNTVNGILIGGNIEIDNFYSNKLNISLKKMYFYIDEIKILNANISQKIGTDYAISFNGTIGDSCEVNSSHIYDTIGTNNHITATFGNNPFKIRNIINGNITLENGIAEINGAHLEHNSYISLKDGNYTLKNIYMWGDNNNNKINVNNSNVSIENYLCRYPANATINNDYDVYLEGKSTVNFNNCYKDILASDLDKHSRSSIKTNISTNDYYFNVNGTLSTVDSNNNDSLSNRRVYDLTDQLYSLNNPTLDGTTKWKLPSSTYYYMGLQLIDPVRKIWRSYNQTQSLSLTNDGSGAKFTVATGFPLRIYRGLASGTYNKYIDYVARDNTIYDNGEICANRKWLDRDTSDTTYNLYGHKVEYIGENIKVWSSTTPSAGTWKAKDQIINNNTASGQPISWVCTEGGTPGTWKAQGSYGA